MLVDEGGNGRPYAGEEERSASGHSPDREKQDGHDRVKERRHDEGSSGAQARRNGSQAFAAVELLVLKRIDDVEARRPEEDREAEEDRQGRNGAAHRDPCPDGRQREAKAEDEMGERGEALRVGVGEQKRQRDRRQQERQPIQARGGSEEEGDRGDEECPHESDREGAGGQGTRGRPGICGIDAAVGEPIVGHRGAPRADHRQQNFRESSCAGPAAGREHRGVERERQRKESMAELDHLERRAERLRDARPGAHGLRFGPRRGAAPFHRKASSPASRPRSARRERSRRRESGRPTVRRGRTRESAATTIPPASVGRRMFSTWTRE